MNVGFAPKNSVFLSTAALSPKLLALFILGGGPFACREWRSLSALLFIIAAVTFARSTQGLVLLILTVVISIIVFLAGGSPFLDSHPELADVLIVFSAYGIGLYAIVLIIPHIDRDELLDRARRSPFRVRSASTWITHVSIAFFESEKGLVVSVAQALRTSGMRVRLFPPWRFPETLGRYLYAFMVGLWLHASNRAYAATIAMRMRLHPRLMAVRSEEVPFSVGTAATLLLTALGAYVVFQDFVTSQFR